MQEHKQKQFFDIFMHEWSKNPKHVLTPSKILGFI